MAFSRYRSQFIPVGALVISVIGFVYSLVMSFGLAADSLCMTSGCEIVEDFRAFGISPWWASTLIFAALAALCFLRMRLASRLLAGLFLAGDCVFLLIMFFIAPCTTCLIGGFIIFCCWLALRIDRAVLITARRIMAGALSATWLVLFILNLGYAANEAIPAWKLDGAAPAGAKIGVFFSPSCPACREAVSVFTGRAVFYPVAENERDYPLIADIAARVDAGQSVRDALEAVLAENEAGGYVAPDLSLWRSLINKIKIMRNQAAVLKHGYNVLPVLVFEGLPAAWTVPAATVPAAPVPDAPAPGVTGPESPAALPDEAAQAEQTDQADSLAPETTAHGRAPGNVPQNTSGGPDLPAGLAPDFDATLECGRGAAEPCDEPAGASAETAAGGATPRPAD